MSKFAHLYQPLKINKYTYKNRIISAPMVFGAVFQHKEASDRAYRKVEACARGGAAAVIVGETSVNFTDAERMPFKSVDYNDYSGPYFESFKKYADLIKKHGAVAMIELFHAGSEKDPLPGQPNPRGPTGFVRKDGIIVDEMDAGMMEKACNDFSIAAAYMQAAGFDGVLIHAGHGWLFSQFLSPLFNKRTDQYGGSLDNRTRFPIEILNSVRKRVGPEFIIEARINGRDGVPGGIESEEVGQFCHMLEGIIDSVHISVGLYNNPVFTNQFSSMFVEHGCNTPLSAMVKRYTSLPVGVVGGINTPELAEKIIAEYKADFVVLARQMIADPEFPNKAQSDHEKGIRSCIRCFTCFPGSPEAGYDTAPDDGTPLMIKIGSCSINPIANLPIAVEDMPKPEGSRNILIVGGGVAGMQAAITAAGRGHKVTLVEKKNKLGGVLSFTRVDVNKRDLWDFVNVLIYEIQTSGVNVILNTEVNPDFIQKMKAEVLILALGSSPILPSIPGLDHALHALQVYDQPNDIGKRVVMVGGGLVGCETGLHLAKTGHDVVVIEMLSRVAKESFGMYREALVLEMQKYSMIDKTGTRCIEITSTGVNVENEDRKQEFIEADTVVYALGMKPNDASEIRSAAGEIPILEAGDCIRARNIGEAVKEGFTVAMGIL